MQELIDTAAEIYREKREIKATALELDLPPGKVKKLLITGNVLSYPETKQIQDLMRQGKTMVEIQHIMDLSYSALHTYLPYSKVIYKMSEISQNAERVKTYKARKSVVDTLMAAPTKGHLWDCIVAFQNYPFYTVSGLPFSYTLKKGRNTGRELHFQPAMAFWNDLSVGGSGEKVERKSEVSKVVYPEESYNLKKLICVAMCRTV